MVERILGVDLGIASLGWAVVEYDKENDINNKIVDCGVRLFTAAETPKEKESPNKARRVARGIRRVLNRRRVRMNEIKKLFVANGLIKPEDLNNDGGMFHSKANHTDVWQLRYEALRRKLAGNELARVLVHIAKHRGFDFDVEDGDSGTVEKAWQELEAKFAEKGSETIGEYLYMSSFESKKGGKQNAIRNKNGKYTNSIPRAKLKEEVEKIFEFQGEAWDKKISWKLPTKDVAEEITLKEAYKEIAFYVRPMQSVEDMVGYCTFFPKDDSKKLKGEKRAPKAAPTAEYSVALGKFFNTVVIDENKNEKKLVELKSIDELMQIAKSKEKVTFKQLRKELGLGETTIFKSVTDESRDWSKMSGNAAFKKALSTEAYVKFIENTDIADEVAKILTYYKATSQKENELNKLFEGIDWIDEANIKELSKLSFSAFNQLSIKALKILNQVMGDGYLRYDEAVKYALDSGLLPKPQNDKKEFLPPLKDTDIDILNPTVIRAFAEFRKVANALVRKYGIFDKVHFELAREVNTKDEKDRWDKASKDNKKLKDRIVEEIKNEATVNAKNILKFRLYKEQGEGFCPYCEKSLERARIFEDGYAQVDHILPRSRSAEDSYTNKVLVHSGCNQDKQNRTPFEWFMDDKKDWARYRLFIDTNFPNMGAKKKRYLAKENFDENSANEFKDRNLNDTRYMARAIKNYCEKYWKLAKDDDKLRIQVRNGRLTNELRGRWVSWYKKDRSIHTHHALDAIVVALSTTSMVQKLHRYYKQKETKGEKNKPEFDAPMPNFAEEVKKALELEKEENGHKRLLISRPPRAGVTGQAHEQNPKPYPRVADIKNKKNRRFAAVDEDKFEKFKNDKIASGDGKNFYEPSTKPRVDIYKKGGKYYVVPLYLSDMVADELPNIALGTNPAKMEKKDFCFSVFKDDIIEVETKATPKKPSKKVLGYFSQLHGANFILSSVDNAPKDGFLCTPVFSMDKDIGKKQKDMCKQCPEENKQSGSCPMQALEFWQQNSVSVPKKDFDCDVGVKFAVAVKKYQIDPLGYYHEIKKERRLGTIPQEAKRNGVYDRRAKKQAEKRAAKGK